MKNTKFLTILCLLIVLLLAACGTKENKVQEKPAKAAAAQDSGKEAVFNGQSDDHSIEVTVDGKTLVLQVSDNMEQQVSSLTEGEKIRVQYSENTNKQYELNAVEKIGK